MPSKGELREALKALAREADAAARGVGGGALVVECRPVGMWGETRSAGLYFENPVKRVGPTIVFEGDGPPEHLLKRFQPADGSAGPLIVVLGPEEIPPPPEGLEAAG